MVHSTPRAAPASALRARCCSLSSVRRSGWSCRRRARRWHWSRPPGRRSPIRPAAALRARSRRGGARTHRRRRKNGDRQRAAVQRRARLRIIRRQRGGVEGFGPRALVALFASVPGEPSRARRAARRGSFGEDARRSKGRVAIVEGYLRRGDRQRRAGLGPLARRRGQPRAAAQWRRRLHADGRARRPLHRQQLPDGTRARLHLGTTPLDTRTVPGDPAVAPDAQSIVDRFNSQLRGMIADRTYHRLLHVDWIRADVDGDGVPEYVPERSARTVGAAARLHAVHRAAPTAPDTAGQNRLLRRRQHLQRVGKRARELQAEWLGCAGSEPRPTAQSSNSPASLRRCRCQPLTRRSS